MRWSPQETEAAPGRGRGGAGEGMAKKEISSKPEPRPMSERGKGMWVQREDPLGLWGGPSAGREEAV